MSTRRSCGIFDINYKQDISVMRTPFHWITFFILMVGFLVVFPIFAGEGFLAIMNLISITIIATLGINFLTGYCGQISLGHAIFVAVGGYITGIFMNRFGFSWWATLPFSATGTAVIGLFFRPSLSPAQRILYRHVHTCFLFHLGMDFDARRSRDRWNQWSAHRCAHDRFL